MKIGLGNLTLSAAWRLATERFEALDSRHGDPSRNANWIRERQLAEIVIDLVNRIEAARDRLDGLDA